MPFIRKSNNLENLRVALGDIHGKVGKVGWFPSAVYESGQPVAQVAAIHEFGAPAANIPPRPFMRPTIAREKTAWHNIVANAAKNVVRGEGKAGDIFETIGLKAAGDIAKSIAMVFTPALKDATIKARLRARADKRTVGNLTKPLVDTGLMIGSITNTVEDE